MRAITTRWIAVVTTFAALAGIYPQAALSQAQPSAKPTRQLLVKLASHHHQAAENFLDALNHANRPEHALRQAQAGSPSRGRFMIEQRLSSERLASLPADHPEQRLHGWVVLTYPNEKAAERARGLMGANSALFEQVVPDVADDGFSVVPNDPLYMHNQAFPGGYTGTSNHVAHSLMNLQSAWNHVPGIAYVANVDNGIQSSHSDLVVNLRPHFSSGAIEEPEPGKRGHGTHTAGIMAAGGNNSAGVAGVCWNCSLMSMRITDSATNYTCSSAIAGMHGGITAGAQVVNTSFGLDTACAGQTSAVNDLVNYAAARQVSMAAAAGNNTGSTQLPASNPYVMSVGAIDGGGAFQSAWSATGKVDFSAVGYRVFSTFYSGETWQSANLANAGPNTNCVHEDNDPNGPWVAYAFCTGTSMSSPFIAGAAALVRSANPMLSDASVKSHLAATANRFGASSGQVGAGVPDVGAAVANALYGAAGNGGLTPLFALLQTGIGNRFYTTVPQMASAAINFGLRHGSIALAGNFGYVPASSEGSTVSGYSFPGASGTPVAAVSISTLQTRYGRTMVGLHRFSYADYGGTALHVYDNYPILTLASGFVRDGVEGYMYSPYAPQPYGTVRLMRKQNASTNRYAVFPETQLGYFSSLGYTTTAGGTDTLGYVCLHPLQNVGACRAFPRTDEAALDWFYTDLLNRAADSGGYNWWLGQIRYTRCNNVNGLTATLDWVNSSFVNSGEFIARGLSNQAFVSAMYRGILRRDADAGGLAFYTGQLNSGAMTRDQVRATLLYSSEFYYGTVAPIASESCI